MFSIRELDDPNVIVGCGISAHARKVSVYMFFIFMFFFGTGIFVLKDYVLFLYCVGNVALLFVNFVGVFTYFKPFLIPGFLVQGSLFCIMITLALELGLAVVFPNLNAPSPLLGFYLNISLLQLGKNWLMRLIATLIALTLFFSIQIPLTFIIAHLKIWREISISDELDKDSHVENTNVEKGEMGKGDEIPTKTAMAAD